MDKVRYAEIKRCNVKEGKGVCLSWSVVGSVHSQTGLKSD